MQNNIHYLCKSGKTLIPIYFLDFDQAKLTKRSTCSLRWRNKKSMVEIFFVSSMSIFQRRTPPCYYVFFRTLESTLIQHRENNSEITELIQK